MCRHLAYIGRPITLASLLFDAPHSLVHQSWAPRQQRYGTINADGYGVGWYQPDIRAEPARFRRAGPMWADRSLESLAQVVRSGAFLAAVRSATPPAPSEESGAAPFTDGHWLFSLNGVVTGDLVALRQQVSARHQAGIVGTSDAEILFALLLDLIGDDDRPEAALAKLVATVAGRLNLLLTDGTTIWATTQGDTLYWRHTAPPGGGGDRPCGGRPIEAGEGDRPGGGRPIEAGGGTGVIVASEPLDDELGWIAVHDGSRLIATTTATGGAVVRVTISEGAPTS